MRPSSGVLLALLLVAVCLLSLARAPGGTAGERAVLPSTPGSASPVDRTGTRGAVAPAAQGSFTVSVTLKTPLGPDAPVTLPVVVTAIAQADAPGCPGEYLSYFFEWGDGTSNTTNNNGSAQAQHYYGNATGNSEISDVVVVVTDPCGGEGTGLAPPTFYPAVGATLSTNLGTAVHLARNLSSLALNFTLVPSGGAPCQSFWTNWSFGDGGRLKDVQLSPGSGLTEPHVFLRPAGWSGPWTADGWVSVNDCLNGNYTTSFQVQLNGTASSSGPPSSGILGLSTVDLVGVVGIVAVVAVVAAVLVALRRRRLREVPGREEQHAPRPSPRQHPLASEELSPDGVASAGGATDRPYRDEAEPSSLGPFPTPEHPSVPPSYERPFPEASGASGGQTASWARTSPEGPAEVAASEGVPSVPCIICGTPLPSVDAPCPRCSPSGRMGRPAPVETVSPLAPEGPPLPGLERHGLTPPPIPVVPGTPAAPSAQPPRPLSASEASPPLPEHPPVSFVPAAPVPEIEPLPEPARPPEASPEVDTSPVEPLPERTSGLSTAGAHPPPPTTEDEGKTGPEAASKPPMVEGPSSHPPSTGAAPSKPFLFPVSTRSLFEKLVESAPSSGAGGPGTGSAPTSSSPSRPVTVSIPAVPTAPSAAAPAAPTSSAPTPGSCLVCGRPLQDGYCSFCGMNWRE